MTRLAATSPSSFLANARRFIGQPYEWGGGHEGGRARVQPVDCSGLVTQAAKLSGINLAGTARDLQRQGRAISKSELRAGDLVFRGNPARHVGIYLGDGKVLHAPRRGTRVRIDTFHANNWGSARRVFEGRAAAVADEAAALGRRSQATGSDADRWSPKMDSFERRDEQGQVQRQQRVIGGLRLGHEGMGVKALQRALTQAGIPVIQDGLYGEHTARAVGRYQRAHGLKVTGRADAATLQALGIAAR